MKKCRKILWGLRICISGESNWHGLGARSQKRNCVYVLIPYPDKNRPSCIEKLMTPFDLSRQEKSNAFPENAIR